MAMVSRHETEKNGQTRLKEIGQPSSPKPYEPHRDSAGSQDEPGLCWREMEGLLEHQGHEKIRPIERRIKQQGGDRSQDEVQITVETELDKRVLTEEFQEEER